MQPAYATKLGLCTRKIDLGIQKIDGFYLDSFEIVIADCLVNNKLERVRFFQETFLLANISLEMDLRIPFLILSKADIRFAEQELVWKTYMAAEALPITRRVKIIDKKEFAIATLNVDDKNFVVHVAALAEPTTMSIHLSCQT